MSRFLDAIRVNNAIDKSWEEFLSKDLIDKIDNVEEKLVCNYTSCDSKVLRFLTVDLNKVKVIVFGQDPYPQKGVATGRSFEVMGVESWTDLKLNNSLRNILKLLYRTYKAIEEGKAITEIENKGINKFKNDIGTNKFPIKALNEIFDYWEGQGVLFLNCSLTCEINNPGGHLNYWDKFNKELVKYIINKRPDAKYFLWGEKVKNIISNIDDFKNVPDELIYECTNPANRNSKAKGNNFLESECFKETMDEITWI